MFGGVGGQVKTSQPSTDLSITLPINTPQTWSSGACTPVCVCVCVYSSVCVGHTLLELFMTGLIGLIEDIKITCQLCVSTLPDLPDNC